jgi:hypothetical protein
MKLFKILLVLSLIFTISCKEEKQKKDTTSSTKTEAIQHYICENKCENSGGDLAGNCPTCNTPYTHNAAYHGDELLKNGPINVQSNATQPTVVAPTSPSTPTPAQNSTGVYHYTCANGCVGGSGEAVNCTTCGEPLAHNTAYHN